MSKELTPLNTIKEGPSGFVKALSEPLSAHGWPVWVVYAMAIIGVIYLLNPTAGVFELIPDIIPGIGNLDESIAVLMIIAGIVEATEGKKYRAGKKNTAQSEPPADAE